MRISHVRLIFVALSLIYFCVPSNGYSQLALENHRVYNDLDGFLMDNVESIEMDMDGLLWLAGYRDDYSRLVNGSNTTVLQRFDGRHFKDFEFRIGGKRVVKIYQILKLPDGSFLFPVKTETGVSSIVFNPYTCEYEEVSLGQPHTISDFFIYEERVYYIYKNTKRGMAYFSLWDKSGDHEKVFDVPEFQPVNFGKYVDMILTADVVVISGINTNCHFYSWSGEYLDDLTQRNINIIRDQYSDDCTMSQVLSTENNHFVFFENDSKTQIFKFDYQEQIFTPLEGELRLDSVSRRGFFQDEMGRNLLVVFRSNRHLDVYSFDEQKIEFRNSIVNTSKLDVIQMFSNDSQKGFWLTGRFGELHYYKLQNPRIKNNLEGESIRAIYPLSVDEFIVTTEEGWYSYNPSDNTAIPWEFSVEHDRSFPLSSRLIVLDQDKLWSSSFSDIICVDPENKSVKEFDSRKVEAMEPLNDSILIYSSRYEGVSGFNIRAHRDSLIFATENLEVVGLSSFQNSIVAATSNGILHYDLEDSSIQLYDSMPDLKDEFFITSLHQQDGRFLLGSRAGQLYEFDSRNGRSKLIYQDDFEAGIARVFIDKELFWITTFNGLVRWNSKTDEVERFSTEDGLCHNEANRYSSFMNDSIFILGTIGGLSYFNKADLEAENPERQLMLLSVETYDPKTQSALIVQNRAELFAQEEFVLPAEQRNIRIEFALRDGLDLSNTHYRYTLNNQRSDLGKTGVIRIPNLAPGTYKLQIEAFDFSNRKIGEPLALTLVSQEYFYRTFWFISLVVIVLGSILSYVVVQSIKSKRIHEVFAQNLIDSRESERTRIATDLHDGLGQQLTLIKRKAQDAGDAEISQLSSAALSDLRAVSRDLYPAVLEQLGLKLSIEGLLDKMDEECDMLFTHDIDEIADQLKGQDALHVYRIIQEGVNNAMKHSQASELVVLLKNLTEQIQISIFDNGTGFNREIALKNGGLGLRILNERTRMLRGNFSIATQNGTHIVIQIPLER